MDGRPFCSFGQVALNKMSIVKLRLCNRNKSEEAWIYFEDVHLTYYDNLETSSQVHKKAFNSQPFIILNKKLKLAPLSFVYLPLRFIPNTIGKCEGLLRGKVCFRNSNIPIDTITLKLSGKGF